MGADATFGVRGGFGDWWGDGLQGKSARVSFLGAVAVGEEVQAGGGGVVRGGVVFLREMVRGGGGRARHCVLRVVLLCPALACVMEVMFAQHKCKCGKESECAQNRAEQSR